MRARPRRRSLPPVHPVAHRVRTPGLPRRTTQRRQEVSPIPSLVLFPSAALTVTPSKRTGLDKALYQVEEALRQVGQDAHSIDAARAVSELKALLQSNPQGQQRTQGIADRKRRNVAASNDPRDRESTSETEDHAESPPSETSAHQVSSPVSSSRNPREESLAVDDAENPLQLLARASNLHLSPPSSENAGSGAASGPRQSLLNRTQKDIPDIEKFFNSTQFTLDTEYDMDPINLGLLSEDEAEGLFAL